MRARLLFVALLVAAGCGGTLSTSTPAPTETPTAGETSLTTAPTAGATAVPQPTGMLAYALADVRTGETFTLGQFAGKVTLVQLMAVW